MFLRAYRRLSFAALLDGCLALLVAACLFHRASIGGLAGAVAPDDASRLLRSGDEVAARSGQAAGGETSAHERPLAVASGTAQGPATTIVDSPDLHVTALERYYDVEGADPRSALASVRQRGPRDGDGEWAASTSWTFRWNYRPVATDACRVQSAAVDLQLTYTFPRWVTASPLAPAIQDAWSTYIANVQTHEAGHGEIARAAAGDLAQRLEQLEPQANCADLAVLVDATVHARLDQHARDQAAYDLATQHGIAQGATLSIVP